MSQTSSPTQNIKAGILWMLVAVFAFCMLAVAVRKLPGFQPFEINLFRCLFALPMILVVVKITGGRLKSDQLPRHALRNGAHFIGQNLWYFALPLLPLAQVFALEFTTPLWVILLAAIFLGEKLTGRRILAGCLGFVGVLLVAQPQTGTLSPGVLAAAASAIGFAFSIILTKRLTATDSVWQILFYMNLMQGTASLVLSGYDGQIHLPQGSEWFWFVVVAFCGVVAHGSLTKALSLGPATIMSPIDYLRLPLSAVVGFVLYDERLALPVILGAALIVGGNYFNIIGGKKPKSDA